MKTIALRLALSLCMLGLATSPAHAGPERDNIDESGVALQGYDPVSYHQGKPAEGKNKITASHDGNTYRFSSEENRQQFEANPDQFIPAYGGWCAWAMLDGEKVKVDPETYKIVDGQTLLFYNTFFINTLKKWNERAASEGEASLSETALQKWAALAK